MHPLLGEESIGLIGEFSLLGTDSKKIPTSQHHQDWVHSLSLPSLHQQEQILQELYKKETEQQKTIFP
jgi:hypothetical protein